MADDYFPYQRKRDHDFVNDLQRNLEVINEAMVEIRALTDVFLKESTNRRISNGENKNETTILGR